MTSTAMPIYKDQDFYVPAFEVKVGDRHLGRQVIRDIIQVSYRDSLEDVDSFEISINNWDANKRSFKYSDDNLFNPGQKLELWMGYFGRNPLRLMLKGKINSLRPSFPAAGQPTLVISGLNLLHSLRMEQRSHVYEQKTDYQIAHEIARRLNIPLEPLEPPQGPQEVYQYVLQNNEYDIVFLWKRAKRIGFDLFVREEGEGGESQPSRLHFGPSDKVKRITYELKYGLSLIDFQPNLTTANQVGTVVVRGWDSVHKKMIEATATRAELSTHGVGNRQDQAAIDQAFNQRQEIIVDHPIHSEQEAKTLATQSLERIAKDMITASGSVVGLPDLRAGSILQIAGVGTRFSGRYFVTSTTHAIGDSGYTTRFECRREEIKENANARN
jgi:uncharacterized protein